MIRPIGGWLADKLGGSIVTQMIGDQIRNGTPENAMYAFAVFYILYNLCMILNWWFYLRRAAYVKNP